MTLSVVHIPDKTVAARMGCVDGNCKPTQIGGTEIIVAARMGCVDGNTDLGCTLFLRKRPMTGRVATLQQFPS